MIEAGRILSILKSRLQHGQFIKMALEQTRLSRSTISRYMQMAANDSRVGHLQSGRDAMAAITALSREFVPQQRATSPVIIDAEMVHPSTAMTIPEPQHSEYPSGEAELPMPESEPINEPETVIVDGTKEDKLPEEVDKENPWDISRQAIAELMKLDDKISSPLGDVLAYIEKRWLLTFNLKNRKL